MVMSIGALMVGVLLFNTIAAALVVLAAYSTMERNIGLGAIGGIGFGTAVIYAQATIGEQMFTITVSEMKQLVIAAAVGAAIGVTATVLTIKPNLE